MSGSYEVQLVVNDGSVDSAPDTVDRSTTENSAPIANAGPDQSVFVGATVTLDGTASSDVDGNPLTYAWSFVSKPAGSTATLSGATSDHPTFIADASGSYEVQLVVNDGSVDSAPDTVTITTENSAPVANAGPDQSVFVAATVTLDGTASSDVDGKPLTYAWSFVSKPAGSTATLSGATSDHPTFVADASGSYEVQLVVNDGSVDSAPDTVVDSTENSAPIANAGPDQSVFVAATVTLDGTASSDVDGNPLTYAWSFVSKPAGSTATLSGATSDHPTFVADASGSYEVQLVVNDGSVDSAPDTVVISTENSAPVANAGPDQSVFVAATVTLDGTASSDVDGNPLTYAWSFVSKPAGSTATLSGATSDHPTFVAERRGRMRSSSSSMTVPSTPLPTPSSSPPRTPHPSPTRAPTRASSSQRR